MDLIANKRTVRRVFEEGFNAGPCRRRWTSA